MRTYEKYKDSGISWIGKVPEDWEVCKVKHHYRLVTGFTPATKVAEFYDSNNGHTWITIADLKGKVVTDSTNKISDYYLREYHQEKVKKGSLLYSFKLSVGQVAFAGKDLYTNEAIAAFQNTPKVNLPFFFYAAPLFIIHNSNINIYGAHILNQDLIKNAYTVFPPLSEQQAIANYLDKKTAEIDKIIAEREKKIELLNELKSSIISRAVTKGINPHAKMKDSGIDWIGEIPEGWITTKLKYLLHLHNGRAYSQDELLTEGKYKVLRVGNFFTNDKWYYSNFELESIKYCNKGDLLYAWSASFGPYIWDQDKTIYHYHIWKVTLEPTYNKKYAYYMLSALTEYKRSDVHGSTMVHVTMESMNNSFITFPPLQEQREIARYLDDKLKGLSLLSNNINSEISLLHEYKQSLISEVVTGKRKVID